MFREMDESDNINGLEEKIRDNTAEFLVHKSEYDNVQGRLNIAIADIYAKRLEEARKKPDTQGVR